MSLCSASTTADVRVCGQEPDLAYRAFRLVALAVAMRVAWRVVLCAVGTLYRLLVWLFVPRWLLGDRAAPSDQLEDEHVGKKEEADEEDEEACSVSGASGDEGEVCANEARDASCAEASRVPSDHTASEPHVEEGQGARTAEEDAWDREVSLPALARLNESVNTETQTTPRPRPSSPEPTNSAPGALTERTRELAQHSSSGAQEYSSTSRMRHTTSHIGQRRLEQIELEVECVLYEVECVLYEEAGAD